MPTLSIALVGDYDPAKRAHVAIPQALALAGQAHGCEVTGTWLPTETLEDGAPARLASFAGVWCVPGSPYASMAGALAAIRYARETGRPFLGTCGGCQHALIEYARNVLGHAQADHAESNPAADFALIAPLSCALVEADGMIRLVPGTRLHVLYGQDTCVETYHCSYGLANRYVELFAASALRVAAVDGEGEVRAVEFDGHPFFLATLFQPERSAFRGECHPVVSAFVEAGVAEGALAR